MTTNFLISKSLLAHHYDVQSENGQQFTAHISKKPKSEEPDLKLAAGGENSTSAAITSVYFPTDKNSIFKVSPDGGGAWIEMDASKAWRHRYTWPGPDGRALVWKRTWSQAVDGMTPGLSHRNYKLMYAEHDNDIDEEGVEDEDTSKVLAVFTAKFGVSSVGTLQLNVSWGEQGDLLVLMTLLSVYETVRRNDGAALGEAGDAAGTAVDAVAG